MVAPMTSLFDLASSNAHRGGCSCAGCRGAREEEALRAIVRKEPETLLELVEEVRRVTPAAK